MTIDDLVVALAKHGTSVRMVETGYALRLRGRQPTPALLAELNRHKADLVTALQEARDLAIELYRGHAVEAFSRELDTAKQQGTISVIDWCAADLAVTLAGRWQRANRERAA